MTYAIELAQPGDFLNVAALDRIAWNAPDTFIPDGEHAWRVWCEYASVLVGREAAGNLEHSGDVAAALVMFPTQQGETFLHKIMVHPQRRGAGLGSALMREALARATTPVLLTVDPVNAAAGRLYRKLGFEVRERVRGYYRPHEDRNVMAYTPAESSMSHETTCRGQPRGVTRPDGRNAQDPRRR